LLVSKGYSKGDIAKMEIEEYNFLVKMKIKLKAKGKDTAFGGI